MTFGVLTGTVVLLGANELDPRQRTLSLSPAILRPEPRGGR